MSFVGLPTCHWQCQAMMLNWLQQPWIGFSSLAFALDGLGRLSFHPLSLFSILHTPFYHAFPCKTQVKGCLELMPMSLDTHMNAVCLQLLKEHYAKGPYKASCSYADSRIREEMVVYYTFMTCSAMWRQQAYSTARQVAAAFFTNTSRSPCAHASAASVSKAMMGAVGRLPGAASQAASMSQSAAFKAWRSEQARCMAGFAASASSMAQAAPRVAEATVNNSCSAAASSSLEGVDGDEDSSNAPSDDEEPGTRHAIERTGVGGGMNPPRLTQATLCITPSITLSPSAATAQLCNTYGLLGMTAGSAILIRAYAAGPSHQPRTGNAHAGYQSQTPLSGQGGRGGRYPQQPGMTAGGEGDGRFRPRPGRGGDAGRGARDQRSDRAGGSVSSSGGQGGGPGGRGGGRGDRPAGYGRQEHYTAMVAVGNMRGLFGLGKADADTSPEAVSGAYMDAFNHLAAIPLYRGHTIYNHIKHEYSNMTVLFMPRPSGWGVRGSDLVTELCNLVGIKDISVKIFGRRQSRFFVAAAFQEALSHHQTVAHDGVEGSGVYIRESNTEWCAALLPIGPHVPACPLHHGEKPRHRQAEAGCQSDGSVIQGDILRRLLRLGFHQLNPKVAVSGIVLSCPTARPWLRCGRQCKGLQLQQPHPHLHAPRVTPSRCRGSLPVTSAYPPDHGCVVPSKERHTCP
ncbi:S5 DRBM domain-containing protein [Haematococcus lacustris]|uniref:S5 DRBM domain-containing protein n=1 Tax=Haematococcus lacustris TaxID=44745 RepID=A0A699ZV85_HAELA|nr:S5 DRBM domain-containing protein [Haematococcus lacustris]